MRFLAVLTLLLLACSTEDSAESPPSSPLSGNQGGKGGASGGGSGGSGQGGAAAGSNAGGAGNAGQGGSDVFGPGGSGGAASGSGGSAGSGGGTAGASGAAAGSGGSSAGAGGSAAGSGGSGQAGSGPAGAGGSGATEDPFEKDRQFCVDKINEYRASIGLPAYERWKEGEACADKMADHDADVQSPHDGFNKGICSPKGNGQNECPGYGSPDALGGCLAQMWAEGPSPDGQWSVAHGHYLNMVGNYTYQGFQVNFTRVACGFSSKGWFLQNFE